MFCENCGEQLKQGQKFCSNCGTPVAVVKGVQNPNFDDEEFFSDDSANQNYNQNYGNSSYKQNNSTQNYNQYQDYDDDDEPLHEVRPYTTVGLNLVRGLFGNLFLIIWGTGFFGGFGFSIFHSGISFLFAFILAIAIVLFRAVYWIPKNNQNTTYTFYKDRVIFHDGFFNTTNRTVYFQSIMELDLRANFLQRQYGIGDIYIFAMSPSGYGSDTFILRDIPEVSDVYAEIQKVARRNNQNFGNFNNMNRNMGRGIPNGQIFRRR